MYNCWSPRMEISSSHKRSLGCVWLRLAGWLAISPSLTHTSMSRSCQSRSLVNVSFRGHQTGASPLYVAAQQGFEKVVSMLLDLKAQVNSSTNVCAQAIRSRSRSCSRVISLAGSLARQLQAGSTPLFIAAQQQKTKVVQLLLKRNSNPNQAKKVSSAPAIDDVLALVLVR